MTTPFPYTLSEDDRATLGVIVLQADETIESDLARLFRPQTSRVFVSRVPSGAELTPETIRQMERDLPSAAGLFPRAMRFDAVAYACTSGTTLIGAERVAELVRGACQAAQVTNPLTAAQAAFAALGVQRLGLVSPYEPEVARPMLAAFEQARVKVVDTVSFGERVKARVARIAPASIAAAARALAGRHDVDGLFLSCTNLRTLDIIDPLERAVGVPVLSSNQVLAWHLAALSGAGLCPEAPGRLFSVAAGHSDHKTVSG